MLITTASPGEIINYSINVSAPLCEAINNYSVVDTLPDNVTFISSDGVYHPTNRTVKINGINLNQGETRSFAVAVSLNPNSYTTPIEFIHDSVPNTSLASIWNTTSTSVHRGKHLH